MAQQLLTKPGTSRLSDLARHVVAPSGIAFTGWPAVRDKCAELGISFDPWQDGAGRLILAKRADGSYAASVGGVVMSIPRQVGKTFLVGAMVFALCLLNPGLTVIWTAHRLRTAAETFAAMQGLAGRRRIKPFVAKVVLGSGDEEIQFRNGSRVLFGARERGFGRGFAQVDVLVFDEAQILTENAIDDMVPATNQSQQPAGALLLFTGTPPKPTDPSQVFRAKRAEALSGASDDGVYLEFSADQDAEPEERKQWAKANPSYPRRTSQAAMLRMKKNLSPESFLREALGIWDDGSAQRGDLDPTRWAELADVDAARGSDVVFGVDLGEDRTVCVAVVWARPDGGTQVMLSMNGVGRPDVGLSPAQAVARLNELTGKWDGPVVLGGPAIDLEDDLTGRKITAAGADFASACGLVADGIVAGSLHHGDQPELNESVRVARWRFRGTEGQREWQLRNASGVGPLAAVTRAVHGLSVGPSVYESRDMVTL